MKDNAKRQITFVTILIWLVSMTSVIASPVFVEHSGHSEMAVMSMGDGAKPDHNMAKTVDKCNCKDDCQTCQCSMCEQSCNTSTLSSMIIHEQNKSINNSSSETNISPFNNSHTISFIASLFRPPIQ